VRPADLAAVSRTRAALASGTARLAREHAGISRTEMAASLGVSRQAVSKWEAGRGITAEHALAYGRLLAKLVKEAA
jgi:DNA-binding transcriptional regulator YiaG